MTTRYGIEQIGHEPPKRPSFFWTFAGRFDLPTLAWWKSGKSLNQMVSLGHSKQSAGTLRNGFRKDEAGMQLETPVVQGFLRRCLKDDQAKRWKKYIQNMQPMRFLIPSEVYKLLQMAPTGKTITDAEKDAMWETWMEFCKERNHDQKSFQGDAEFQIAWFDYVASHYTDPLPAVDESRKWMDGE